MPFLQPQVGRFVTLAGPDNHSSEPPTAPGLAQRHGNCPAYLSGIAVLQPALPLRWGHMVLTAGIFGGFSDEQ